MSCELATLTVPKLCVVSALYKRHRNGAFVCMQRASGRVLSTGLIDLGKPLSPSELKSTRRQWEAQDA